MIIKHSIFYYKKSFRSYNLKQTIILKNLSLITNKHLIFENIFMKIDNEENNKFLGEYEYFIKIYEKGNFILNVSQLFFNFIKFIYNIRT